MDKVFAIIRPSTTFTPGASALADAFVDLYHQRYPSIYGCSLGHEPLFFDKLDDAKNYLFPPQVIEEWDWYKRERGQYVIIELDVENSDVKNVTASYHFRGFHETVNQVNYEHNHSEYVRVKSPNWAIRKSEPGEVSAEALQSLSEMLKVRYVNPHEVDRMSKHPKAQLCRQLSAKFNQQHGSPAKHLLQGEAALAAGGGMAFGLSLCCLILPETRIAAAVLFAIGALSTYAGMRRVSNAEAQQTIKIDYIRNNLFANNAGSPETAPSTIAALPGKKM